MLNPLFSEESNGEEIAGLIIGDEIAGVIMGEEIGIRELQTRAVMYEFSGEEDPLSVAWDSYKVTVYEKQFAEEHGLIPTDDEVWEFTQQMKSQVYNAPDGGMHVDALLTAMGFVDSNEYWDDYKVEYESPAHLISINIARYINENNIEWPTEEEMIDACPGEITNEALLEVWANRSTQE
jgi:hypothetical protein